ncbi:MAG: glycosyltransferase [Bacteroidota bacterium]|jgi:glycosyltransferase involved in cell wall biosynthesis
MIRILVLNNYSICRVLIEYEKEKKPSHHLYGIVELKKMGYSIIISDPNNRSFLYKFSNILRRIPLFYVGNLQQQFEAILSYKNYDLVYAPCQDTTIFLGVLSYFKLFRKPIIALAHHPMLRGQLANFRKYSLFFSINGHYQFLSLSKIVETQLNYIAKKDISQEMFWGPDLNYYNKVNTEIQKPIKIYDIISVGRTGRDYHTLIKAFNNTSIKVCIYCSDELKKLLPPFYTDNITIKWLQSQEALDYIELIGMYLSAKILAIPMHDEDSLCGLTSLTDSIALGMPTIITRNKYINIDPELNHFGIWVDAYDVNAWKAAADKILNDTNLFEAMSKNAKQIASTTFNINLFSSSLIKIIDNN